MMRCHGRVAFLIVALILSGCVDLTAVGNFAKESSQISANKAMLDDTDAQTEARAYAHTHNMADAESSLADPASAAFKDRLAVTNSALAALNSYMTVLAQLSAKNSASVSSNVSSMESSLKSLKVTDPTVKPALDATSALASILLNATIRQSVAALITNAAAPVRQITIYLADQAQTTSNTYTQAVRFNQQYWSDLTTQTPADKKFCATANLCEAVYALATHARNAASTELTAKAQAAAAAVIAFQKIGKDNDALAANVNNLNSDALVATLKADEPYLLSAIQALESL
jgi:hypothetical protein